MVMDEEIDLDALKTYSTPDILICGNCRYVSLNFILFLTDPNLKIKASTVNAS